MESIKLNKKDLAELFKIAKANKLKSEDDVDETDNFSKVQKFILIFKIKEGKNKVMANMIYHTYSQWAETPLGKREFANQFVKFFNIKASGRKTYYELNYKPMKLVKKLEQLTDKRKWQNEDK